MFIGPFLYSDPALRSSAGIVRLLHNGFPVASGNCDDSHTLVLTAEYGGEYRCAAYPPDSSTLLGVSDIRTLNMLGNYSQYHLEIIIIMIPHCPH